MKTKHIVTKTSTRSQIKSGRTRAPVMRAGLTITADGSDSVRIETQGGWMQADDLRATAKLLKKLADALDRPAPVVRRGIV